MTGKVFISYSHKDERAKNELQSQLNVGVMAGKLEIWDDRQIGIGGDWEAEIETALDKASAAIFLISADFLGSSFINGVEVPALLKRRQEEGLPIFPLIWLDCDWEAVDWLPKMNMFPRDAKALGKMAKPKRAQHLAEFSGIVRKNYENATQRTFEFTDQRNLENWLEEQPREVSAVIAARSALRVAPVLINETRNSAKKNSDAFLLACFRAMAVASFASTWPKLATAASAAAASAASAASADATRAAAYAARAAAYAARAAASDASAAAADAARASAAASASAASNALGIWAEISVDAEFLQNGFSKADELADLVQALSATPIWQGGIPTDVEHDWAEFQTDLRAKNEGWGVWIDWYNAKLEGRLGNPDLDRARATIADEDWKKGPKHVNGLIAKLIEDQVRRRTPIASQILIDEDTGVIAARPPATRETTIDEPSVRALVARHKRRIEGDMARLRDDAGNAQFQSLWPALVKLGTVIGEVFDPEDWHDEIEGISREIETLRSDGSLPARAAELERFQLTLDKAAYALNDRYPAIARADEGRRAQRLRRLSDQELQLLEKGVEAFADVLDDGLKIEVGDDLQALRDQAAAQPLDPDHDLPIPESQTKIRLYRLRGTILRIRALARTAPEKLDAIIKRADVAARKIVQYKKASEALDKLWDGVWEWFTGGGSGL